MKHSLQIAAYEANNLLKTICDYNEQDAEWTIDYGAPGYYFQTNDDKLADDMFGYANAHNLVIDYIVLNEEV